MPFPVSIPRRLGLAGLIGAVLPHGAGAAGLPEPKGRVILTISGAVANTNRDGLALFDREMLLALGLRRLRTSTAWTDGVLDFEGVLLRELLARVGATGTTIQAMALDDYEARIPRSDAERHDVLLALRVNGADLTPDNKGPAWIVYPRDSVPALRSPLYDHRSVWQIRELRLL
ncbi:molybdopterin-dependent oxidoreductase [Roseomonas sp. SSH11]|uniref:Molybdopterin-dependent oxidoreductase n=1 Tax=Pararoseomonas baculiformis TaxID=2820812 RepID=A0ABS4AEQ9_9PROT|nr:molybdopterin-dependent oxidoreductase [Pararoseomonas baculiformis]MBP0445471.1 molybdopterin-dependent oxidoreductase [Pararoseomonas baculiformis]